MKKLAILITLLLVASLSGCYSSNQILADRMVEKYSEAQSYVALSGEIIEVNENNVTIKCEELNKYISYENDLCEYLIYSDVILVLSVGDKVDFATVPFHFYNGHKLPIVELKIDGDTLLSFEEGKENLLYFVNTNFR